MGCKLTFEIHFEPKGFHFIEVKADTEDQAVALAWEQFKASPPEIEWDVETVTNLDEEADEDRKEAS